MARACEQVVLKFTAHFDAGNYAQMEPLFATNSVWKRQDGDIYGLAHFREWSKGRTASIFVRHVLSNLRTTVSDAGKATVDSYVTVYQHDFSGEPVLPTPLTGPALKGRARGCHPGGRGDHKRRRRGARAAGRQGARHAAVGAECMAPDQARR